MLPKKDGKPIAFKCTAEFRKETEAIADSLGISLSDYCRKAVEYYNAVTNKRDYRDKLAADTLNNPFEVVPMEADKITVGEIHVEPTERMKKDSEKASKLEETLSRPPKYPKNDMVKPLFKGGK